MPFDRRKFIIGLIISTVSFIAGFILGRITCPPCYIHSIHSGYPFGFVTFSKNSKNKKLRILSFVVSGLLVLLTPAYCQAIKYGVFKNNKKII